MCEHCESYEFFKNLWVRPNFDAKKAEQVWTIYIKFGEKSFAAYDGIKFCPMCGRQLVENIPKGNTFSVDNI